MSSGSQEPPTPQLLGAFISLLGILSIFLYFTGWIYRWAYFGFFELEINTLNLPLESFLIVPIQVILGDFWIFSRAVLAVVVTVGLIQITLWLLSPRAARTSNASSLFNRLARMHGCWLFKGLRSFAKLFPLPLRHEIAIIA